jgi:hypothetical protein
MELSNLNEFMPMIDQEGASNLFNHIMELWVNPEIERRKLNGTLNDPLLIDKCLITLPTGNPAVVKFNREFGWVARMKKEPGVAIQKGQPIYIHQVVAIERVQLPTIDGKPVAFVYFVREGVDTFNIFFDFSPNHSDFNPSDWDKSPLAEQIAESIRRGLVRQAINFQVSCQDQLQKIGLWTVPSLLPYPLTKIVFELQQNNTDNARSILLNYCKASFISEISAKWWSVKEFDFRKPLLDGAVSAHNEGKYVLSIPALLPQIEGIVTDWIYKQIPKTDFPNKIYPKATKFKEALLSKPTADSYQQIVNSTINFILHGPVFSSFKQWMDDVTKVFPNRHAVEHGKYDPCFYTEENSLKLILLIDTLSYIISQQAGSK